MLKEFSRHCVLDYFLINRFLKGRVRVPAFFFNIVAGLIVGTCIVACSQDVPENPTDSSVDGQLNTVMNDGRSEVHEIGASVPVGFSTQGAIALAPGELAAD